jgi:predicted ATP-grasp superfamily ATP-dependent carboligase
MTVVLLTDGEQRATLALARSLGRAGYRVYVTSYSGKSLAGASRHTSGDFAVPDPLRAPESFAGRIGRLMEQLGVTLLIPVSEAALLALLGAPEINQACIPFPPLATVRAICDKADVLRVAPEVGIAVPRQLSAASPEEVLRLDPGSLVYPLVLKPSRSVSGQGSDQVKLGVVHVADRAQLQSALAALPAVAYPLLIQQRIVGPGIGIFLLVWNGRLVAQFSHRRIREKPPAGGVSVYREGIAADPDLVARSRALLDRFGWQGVAMVEYKVEASTGTPYLMEINGRFWGSLQLAIDCGVDFPRLLAEAWSGAPVTPVLDYRTGVRSRWWWGDVDHLIARVRGTPASLGLPPGAPGRLRALGDFLKLWRPGDCHETLRWSDPFPFFRESVLWLKGR